MRLSCHGAAGQVTGSCHLVKVGNTRILIDCGMFQGGREIEEENSEPFGFDPAAIDVLLLTHAHLDHCGRIPLLVSKGFRGEIICTAATRELARLVLLDAAHLHEGVTTGAIDRNIQVFLDAPMAISATEIFRRHPEAIRDDVRHLFEEGRDPLNLNGLHFVRETSGSMALNTIGTARLASVDGNTGRDVTRARRKFAHRGPLAAAFDFADRTSTDAAILRNLRRSTGSLCAVMGHGGNSILASWTSSFDDRPASRSYCEPRSYDARYPALPPERYSG